MVARWFLQQEGVDYNEINASVFDSMSISLLVAIANPKNWKLEQMDIVKAFLHCRLEEKEMGIAKP